MEIYRHPRAPQVEQLLAACDLPASDLSPGHLEHFFACGAAADCRGMGCGKALVAEAERYARLRGVTRLYLLTTTAGQFFEYVPPPRHLW